MLLSLALVYSGLFAHMPDRVVFGLDPASTKAIGRDSLQSISHSLLQQRGGGSLRRVFPGHGSPEKSYTLSGDRLADLSLIYEAYLTDQSQGASFISALLYLGVAEWAEYRPLPRSQQHSQGVEVYIPDDSLLYRQYHLHNIRAFQAWAISRGDTTQTLAIVDTGTDRFHPDLTRAIQYNYNDPVNGQDSDQDGYIDNFFGWDLGEGNNDTQFGASAHGVHVAGIAAATPDNHEGIAGVGFHSRFLPVKTDDEFGRLVKAYEGIVYAADQGAGVINCSWGGTFGGGRFGQEIIRYATFNRDALVVAAAGNNGNAGRFFPAAFDHVLSVGATDSLDQKWIQSSYGFYTDIMAPGVLVLSTWPGAGYIVSSGTSMAAPMVSGAAAILRKQYPDWNALQVAARLKSTADRVDTLPANQMLAGMLGEGRLNMLRSLTDPLRPYIRIPGRQAWGILTGPSHAGQVLELVMPFENLLAGAANVRVSLSCASPWVEVLQAEANLGNMDQGETLSNELQPFIIRLDDHMPLNHETVLHFKFTGAGEEYYNSAHMYVDLNQSFRHVESGRLTTTLNGRGTLGYNYPNFYQGKGLMFQDGFTRIRSAGLLIGTGPDRVADNLYGPPGVFFNQHFTEGVPLHEKPSDGFSDRLFAGSFHVADPMLGFQGLLINYNIRFWDEQLEGASFMILEYLLGNISNHNLEGLYFAFMADWLLRNAKQHRASYDSWRQLAWTGAENGDTSGFNAIQLLSHPVANHYAFDVPGHDGSIQINNGFTMAEKFEAMTRSRPMAGSYRPDNDVASMISGGPYTIQSGDSLRIVFAMHAAAGYEPLMRSADRARDIWQQISGEQPPVSAASVMPGNNDSGIKVWPNPFTGFIRVSLNNLPPGEFSFIVKDMAGNQLVFQNEYHDGSNESVYLLQLDDNQNGIYYLQALSPQFSHASILLKINQSK